MVDFSVQDFDDTNIGSDGANLLIDSINSKGIYSMKERISLDKVINEQKLGMTGLIDENSAAQIGKLHGVQGVIVGNVMKFGDYYIITARLVDVNSASILNTAKLKVNSINEIAENIDQLTEKLCPTNVVKCPK